MQLSEAYTTPSFTYGSFSRQKPKGTAKSARTALYYYYIRKSRKEDMTILKFIDGQLYSGKLAYTYKQASTDACPLYMRIARLMHPHCRRMQIP